jgi:DNA-binding LacI/PurR family transcriptional regulator
MARSSGGRVTQRQIAELAGVSQATVSLVLNHGGAGETRIPEETRARVLRVIEETQYVADPSARRLAGMDNRIIGVFTYEPAFPSRIQEYYGPLLTGIEQAAEEVGCDLLMFTSAPVTDGRRKIFHEGSRLRLADGVLLLGVEMDAGELERLVTGGFRVVAVGRRDTPGIPSVGVDYAGGARRVVAQALDLGHRRVVHLHLPREGESVRDRFAGAGQAFAAAGVEPVVVPAGPEDAEAAWAAVRGAGDPTLLVVEDAALATALVLRARDAGLRVPEDLSVVSLLPPARADAALVDLTRLDPPRGEIGRQAVLLLARILHGDPPPEDGLRTLVECPVVPGTTLAPPRAG